MEIKNMDKLPGSAAKKVEPYVRQIVEMYGESLVSVFSYGSVTGPEYSERSSDVNLGIVLDRISLEQLKKSLPLIKKGLRKKITAPLFLDSSYIEMSLDTFPIEFIEMKDTRCLLYGDDVLSTVVVKKDDIRRECESQLKGKLLALRQAYLEQAMGRKGLETLIKNAFRALTPVLRNMLRIHKDSTPPFSREEMLVDFGKAFEVDMSPFLEVLGDKRMDGRIGEKHAEEFVGEFMDVLSKLSVEIDKI